MDTLRTFLLWNRTRFGSLQKGRFTPIGPHVAHLMIAPAIFSIPICIVRHVSTPFGIVRFGTIAS